MARKISLLLALSAILLATSCNGSTTLPLTSTPVAPSPTATSRPTSVRTLMPTPTPFSQSNLAQIERDIPYCTIQSVDLKLDLYLPKKSSSRPFPVAVNIHGGSWSGGDKGNSDSAADIPEFIDRGYVVAAVNYRLAPTYQFPAQIEDVKCAIRFLRAHAQSYNLDPNRIGAWGCSAGGHLAALLGLTDPSAGFDQGEYAKESSRVQVVATLSTPMDITLYDPTARAEMLHKVFGTNTDKTILAKASPVNYASQNAAPFLIFQGNRDSLIAPKNGENLVERLNALGGSADLITVENGTHCFAPDSSMNPNRAEIATLIVNFFDQHLRR